MNTLHLKALLLAAETGSISAAARQMGKKQSQLSQWISDLEIDLGVQFFERTGNKTMLSEDGASLLPHLAHTLSQFDKFVQSAEVIANHEPKVLCIGIENYIPDNAFTPPMAHILALLQLNIELYRDERAQLEQDLADGHVDIIMMHESDTLHHKSFDYCRLGQYREVLLCSPNHPLAQHACVTNQDLSQYRELVWGDASEGDSDETNDGFSPCYALFSDLSSLIAMLIRHQGFAFLPQACVSTYLESGHLVELYCEVEPADIQRRVELCWRNGLAFSDTGRTALAAFREHHQLSK
ncbi:LysR family transcriptional regulator [Photobacterium sp. TY1-4]|uniref:LysR family transcriptional regulator n=1 Tax=Photobacterium sp. TY1-4 TaxID=2899122 RepID=UPI0021C14DE9|nr:LysR family transcriptional regulator [Photobacterium sp. TY1-4]UXI04541.1 LysR family transcriptional regulator [Photobacterium sp. TY1-4]